MTRTTTTAAVEPGDIWWSADQREIDTLAVSLLDHPEVLAAKERAVNRFRSSPEFAVADAPATLSTAVDQLLFSSLQFAVIDDPSRPKVLWTVRRPYTADGQEFPGSHYGADNPDRVYRVIGVSSRHRYRISGRRHPIHPTEDDLSVESVPGPGLWGQPTVRLPRQGIDIDDDGSFSVIADGTATEGRRNHLHLPPDTKIVVVRDTLLDWANQVPNQLAVELLDGPATLPRDEDAIARAGVAIYEQSVELTVGFLGNCLRSLPANELVAFERPVKWGMAGGLFAVNRFELGDAEALVITLEQLSARYLTISACDPWTTALPYDTYRASLNNVQAEPNVDGSYTFVLSPRDPGVFNWIDTAGLHTGAVVARWESMTERPPTAASGSDDHKAWSPGTRVVEHAVRESRVLPVSEVSAAIPEGQARVTPARREQLVARRLAEHRVRVTGVVVPSEAQERQP